MAAVRDKSDEVVTGDRRGSARLLASLPLSPYGRSLGHLVSLYSEIFRQHIHLPVSASFISMSSVASGHAL